MNCLDREKTGRNEAGEGENIGGRQTAGGSYISTTACIGRHSGPLGPVGGYVSEMRITSVRLHVGVQDKLKNNNSSTVAGGGARRCGRGVVSRRSVDA